MSDYVEKLVSTAPLIVRRQIRWGECDPACVVYTPNFAHYAVAARDWFFRIVLRIEDQPSRGAGGIAYPARALSFDFLSFLEPGDWFDMAVGIPQIGNTSFVLAIHGTGSDGRPTFEASLTSICFDLDRRVTVLLPDSIRGALTSYAREYSDCRPC